MNNFIKRITCSKIDSLNEDVEVNNSVDEIYSSCETVSENTNDEMHKNGNDSGLIDYTSTEVLGEIPDNEKEDSSMKMEDKKTRDTGEESHDETKIPDTRTERQIITDQVCRTELDNDKAKICNQESRSEINRLVFLESHYFKLGETHAYICVLERSAVT